MQKLAAVNTWKEKKNSLILTNSQCWKLQEITGVWQQKERLPPLIINSKFPRDIYNVLCETHSATAHRGRDKTERYMRNSYAGISQDSNNGKELKSKTMSKLWRKNKITQVHGAPQTPPWWKGITAPSENILNILHKTQEILGKCCGKTECTHPEFCLSIWPSTTTWKH